jgi:hypothetical protein
MTLGSVLRLGICLAAMTGCRGEPAATTAQASGGAAAAPAVPASNRPSPLVEAPRADKVRVKTPDGSRWIEIQAKGRTVEIAYADSGTSRELVGQERDTGKRKYGAPGGAVDVEVRPQDAGFKLRTATGTLLWKVKIDEDKIKVSDNDENRNAWVLKTKYDDKVKVVDPSDTEVGEVKFYRDRQKVKVKDMSGAELFESNTTRYSAAFGVLLMPSVPAGHREIIMAEILARGR